MFYEHLPSPGGGLQMRCKELVSLKVDGVCFHFNFISIYKNNSEHFSLYKRIWKLRNVYEENICCWLVKIKVPAHDSVTQLIYLSARMVVFTLMYLKQFLLGIYCLNHT